METGNYIDTLITTFRRMSDGEVRVLKKAEKSYAKYIQTVKQIIDQGLDIYNGFEMEFNSDYSKIRKRDSIFNNSSTQQFGK